MGSKEDPSDKAELLALIRSERMRLRQVLASLSDARLQMPGLDGERSIKDILAHLSGWQQRMILWLRQSLEGQTPNRPAPDEDWPDLDRLNETIFMEYRATPLEEVRSTWDSTHQEALHTVEAMEESDLFRDDRFPWRKGDPIWHLVADNTYRHDREHREQIEAWLERAS